MELASGQPYAQFVAERILAPLGLTATAVGGRPDELAARGHQDGQPVAPFDLDTMPGTGDLCCGRCSRRTRPSTTITRT